MSYKDHLVHWYGMSELVGMPDLGNPGGNPGVGANIVSNPHGMPGGRCAEFNGADSNYNLGDIVEINAVEKFTLAFWMNQRVIDVVDNFWQKKVSGSEWMWAWTAADGFLTVRNIVGGVSSYGRFDYSTVISAGRWHQLVLVFDGSQADNVNRLVIYVDAVPVTLAFSGTIPAATPNLAGGDFTIGYTGSSFDGKFDEWMFFTDPLTRLQVADLKVATEQGRF